MFRYYHRPAGLFAECRASLKYSTLIKTSPLHVKDCKFRPMFGTRCYKAVRCFFDLPHILWVTQNIRFKVWHVIFTPITECFAVTTCFKDFGLSRSGFERKTFRTRDERLTNSATWPVWWREAMSGQLPQTTEQKHTPQNRLCSLV